MKNLKIIFTLLLFPFLLLIKLPLFRSLNINYLQRRSEHRESFKFSIPRYKTIFLLCFAFLIIPVTVSAGNKSVSINDVSLNEGDSGTTTFTFTVTATDNTVGGETVDYTTVDGSATTADSDYIHNSDTITFAKGDRTQTISIEVNGDTNIESTETFTVILSNPSGGAIANIADGTGLGTIVDDEEKSHTLTAGSIVIDESIGTANVPIRVDPAIYDDTIITVGYSTLDDSAIAGSDYSSESGSVTISSADTIAGSSTVNIPITIINDSVTESQEIFHLKLNSSSISSTLGHTVDIANDTGDITINDNDGTMPTLSVNDVTIFESDDPNFMTFTVSLSSILSQEVVFSYATYGITATADDDFIGSSGTATIPPNTSNITISVLIIGDDEAGEGDETLEFRIGTSSSLVQLGKDIGIGTIKDDDTGLTLSLNDASIAERDYNVTADVKILFSQALLSDLNLTYTTSDNTAISPDDYNGTSSPIEITIPAGSTEYTLEFTIVGDEIIESNENFTITIENVSTAEAIVVAKDTGKVTIFDDDANIGCSSYIGLMTINEYQNNPNYKDDYGHPLANTAGFVPGNYVEIKYLDFLVKQQITDAWNIAVYTTAGSHQLHWNEKDDACIDPRYEVFQMDNNVMGKEGYVVLSDQNGNEVDVLNIANSNHYVQKCHDFIYDTDFESDAQNKDIFRDPDGTGDWFDHGTGANSGGSRCINRDGFSGGLQFTKFDAIDTGVTPATPILGGESVPIMTKIVNQPFPLDILSLEPSTGLLTPSTIKVRTYLADGISGEILPGIAEGDYKEVIFTNNTTVTRAGYNYGSVHKIVRLRFEYCGNDLGAYEDWDQCWLADDVISQSNRRISHSRNAFAIRPDNFNVNIAPGATLTAGEVQTGLSFTAEDGTTPTPAATPLYNEIENSSFTVDVKISDTTKVCQNQDINITPDVAFTNGLHTGDFIFHDVGDVNMTINEIDGAEFAQVDQGDTSDALRFIEPFHVIFTLVPDHFDIDANLTDHNKDTNLTYLHDMNRTNDYSMGAVLSIDIAAVGADNQITRNYMETCYAKDTNLTLALLNPINITYPGTTAALTQFLYYNPVEDNGSVDSGEGYDPFSEPVTSPIIITSLPIENSPASFPNTAPSGDGTTHIEYKLNFDRKQNLVVNPFQIDLSSVNIIDADSIGGTTGTLSGQNTNLYYARSRPSKLFYEDNVESSTATPIAIDVYCDAGFTACKTTGGGIDTDAAQLNEINWWISLGHRENSTQHDGNVTLQIGNVIEGAGSPSVSPTNVQIISQGKNENVIVTSGATTVPMTVKIELVNRIDSGSPAYSAVASPYTNNWLVYNKNSATIVPDPFYRVRFINTSDWAGVGDTGYVLETNASSRKTKRLDW